MKYKLIAKTNPYIAQRNIIFNGKCEITIEDNLTLKEAQKKLLEQFNKCNDTMYLNWNLVVYNTRNRIDNAYYHVGGMYGFHYDSKNYAIEPDIMDEL